jgi:hypothetical protein
VKIHIIYTESEQAILDTLLGKWENHKHLTKEMTTIMRENGLNILLYYFLYPFYLE